MVKETWILHLYSPQPTPPPVYISSHYSSSSWASVSTLLHHPHERISIHPANKWLLFFGTRFLLSEYEFSLKHPAIIHFL